MIFTNPEPISVRLLAAAALLVSRRRRQANGPKAHRMKTFQVTNDPPIVVE